MRYARGALRAGGLRRQDRELPAHAEGLELRGPTLPAAGPGARREVEVSGSAGSELIPARPTRGSVWLGVEYVGAR